MPRFFGPWKWEYSTHAKAGLSLPFAKDYPPDHPHASPAEPTVDKSQGPLTSLPLELAHIVFSYALPIEISVQHIRRWEHHKESGVKILVINHQQFYDGDEGVSLHAIAAVSKCWRRFVKHLFYEEHEWCFDDCLRLEKLFTPLKCLNRYGASSSKEPEVSNNDHLFHQLKPTLHRIRKIRLAKWHRTKFPLAMKCLLQLDHLTSLNISSHAIRPLKRFAKSRTNAARKARLDPSLEYPANFEDGRLVVFADAPEVKEFCDGFLDGYKYLADKYHESLLQITKVDVENLMVKVYTRHQMVYDPDDPRPKDPLYKVPLYRIVWLWDYLLGELRNHIPVWEKTQHRRQPKKRKTNSGATVKAFEGGGNSSTTTMVNGVSSNDTATGPAVSAQSHPIGSPTMGSATGPIDGRASSPTSTGFDMSLGSSSTDAAPYSATLSRSSFEHVQDHAAIPILHSTDHGRCAFPGPSGIYDDQENLIYFDEE
ncbi:hypothetical protein SLS56_005030 [Neofusicoccum ribis]|uniref:F-box domain-containing protein n=1 Tax=Neofusicoccum ribis TaxID=45134 RepID=A0ABR3SUY4_9PEZI